MKAWRNIKDNNGKRPTQRTKIQGSTWLLEGLLIRAGIIDPLPKLARVLRETYAPTPAPTPLPWWLRVKAHIARVFG
jgi:hypothetical protein